ncbi:erythromycin esterase family protein [Longimicrobium sp.]|jgi:erythromycin esterase-like protein|uniref:erythromycin esterase family protein n=1 Tax=Longimicrobium sp. TaxID=2029185 RepID=UPI002EDB24BA
MRSNRLERAMTALGMALLGACANSGGGQAVADAAPRPGDVDGAVEIVRAAAIPLTGAETDYDALIAQVGDARFVLLGEATHGTHEFYRERARITQRLIRDKGFTAVAIEGEWPDAMRVDRFIHGEPGAATPEQALVGFTSGFPQWMWANTDIRDLAGWLRTHNQAQPAAQRVSFYGLDVYSFYESADSVVSFLSRTDPAAAARARQRYACFSRHRPNPQEYGMAANTAGRPLCREQAVAQAAEMEERYQAHPHVGADTRADDELFSAMQHARVVRNAEEYYRVMFEGGPTSWNQRDRHMAQTLESIVTHLEAQGKTPKVVVWAHNTHSGDARMTEMGSGGELNVGQLMRQAYAERSFLVGFTTYAGTVLAAEEWDAPGRLRRLNPALPESYSGLFHRTGLPAFLLTFRGREELSRVLGEPRLERAVGVIYAPRTERQSHYFNAVMSKQFDAVIHVDSSTAVTPLRIR